MNLKCLLIPYYVLLTSSSPSLFTALPNNVTDINSNKPADNEAPSFAKLDRIANTVDVNNNHSNLSLGLLVFFLILTILLASLTFYHSIKKSRELELRMKKIEEGFKIFTTNVRELKYDTIIGMEHNENINSNEMRARQEDEDE
ncbi:hypothetical protein CONCODRAFT_73640 [Conidiobolus coronatus NRRL 28638]|uniref:Uncharacterized protein n=1 Tax=Conidiobolus coronatus (strain ATCC 28846 / CBS 209.66 / NRRL 28638) TaxID=796925 RepID=A0A137NUR5_CONC2|nr:hypothetical protein CONCODRAFT_73640 [Conidiobolus coronatus NRRL 28638]|eukprot:KXN66499.1 hypothetical protein CONCODRAFT_73640 [Conidiobolus coronatus NRRL 28638]